MEPKVKNGPLLLDLSEEEMKEFKNHPSSKDPRNRVHKPNKNFRCRSEKDLIHPENPLLSKKVRTLLKKDPNHFSPEDNIQPGIEYGSRFRKTLADPGNTISAAERHYINIDRKCLQNQFTWSNTQKIGGQILHLLTKKDARPPGRFLKNSHEIRKFTRKNLGTKHQTFFNNHPEVFGISNRKSRGRPRLPVAPWLYYGYANQRTIEGKACIIREWERWHLENYGFIPSPLQKTNCDILSLFLFERAWDEDGHQTITNKRLTVFDHLCLTRGLETEYDFMYFERLIRRLVWNVSLKEDVKKAPIILRTFLDLLTDPIEFWTILLWIQTGMRYTTFTMMTNCSIRLFKNLMLLFPVTGLKTAACAGGNTPVPVFCNCCKKHGRKYCVIHNMPENVVFPVPKNLIGRALKKIGAKGHSPRRTLAAVLKAALTENLIERKHVNAWMLWKENSHMLEEYTVDLNIVAQRGESIPVEFVFNAIKYRDILGDPDVHNGLARVLDENPALARKFKNAFQIKKGQSTFLEIIREIKEFDNQ